MSGREERKTWGIINTVIGVILAVVIFLVIVLPSKPITPIELESYGTSEVIDLSAESYNQMISEKKSFVLMIDNPGCMTTAKMREMMAEFADNYQFKYYRIYWPDTHDTNIRKYVNYFPSIMIIDKGEVKASLKADSDADAKYYNNASDLQDWLKKYVKFQ